MTQARTPRHGQGRALRLAIAVAIVLLALVLVPNPFFAGVVGRSPTPPPRYEGSSAESWVTEARRQGSGAIRTIDGAGVEREILVDATARFSERGDQMIKEWLGSELELQQEKLSEVMAKEARSVEDYRRQLKVLARLEKLMAIRELADRGAYLVLPVDKPQPDIPSSSGLLPFYVGAFPLEAGGVGQALFLIDRESRAGLADVTNALGEVKEAEREERRSAFNALPIEQRRRWVDRYFELLSVVEKTGCSALTKEDLRGFLKMQNEVVELAVRVDRDNALMLPSR
ncbi:MAG: hypothetical protein K8J09_17495 [Planctomycetes bacterium]|nr:hypothetical protein [Planctomycetota bacterium]MCC7397341.1 hypothetical protein [Planctomycetota bacterium]